MSREKIINWAVFVLLSFIWGSSFILMKASAETLNGWQIGSVRIFSAGLVFLPFAVVHLAQIPKNKIALVIISGVMGNLFPAFLFAIAIHKKVDSSLAGILNSLTPLFVILLSVLFFRKKMETKKLVGVLVGFVGLLILSLSKGGITISNFWFTMLILLATLFYGINVNIVSFYLKEVDPFKMATVSLSLIAIAAAIVMWQQGVFSLLFQDSSARKAIGAASLLGVVGSAIATALFYVLIKRAGGLFASLVTYGIPVVAILWGIWDKENVTAIQVSCLAMILGGVYLANKS